MLLERRTVDDLEAVLAERLEVIRGRRGAPAASENDTRRTRQRKSA
jgi:hypothetical protein